MHALSSFLKKLTRLAGAAALLAFPLATPAALAQSGLLDAKAPQHSAAFKQWLRTISDKVAQAASEGGVLGIGGQKVSPAEESALTNIAKALGVAA